MSASSVAFEPPRDDEHVGLLVERASVARLGEVVR